MFSVDLPKTNMLPEQNIPYYEGNIKPDVNTIFVETEDY